MIDPRTLRAESAKKKRTPRQEAQEREREERRAIAQAVRSANEAHAFLYPGTPYALAARKSAPKGPRK